jgi:hypothetical protein
MLILALFIARKRKQPKYSLKNKWMTKHNIALQWTVSQQGKWNKVGYKTG